MKRRTMFGVLAVPLVGLVMGVGAFAWAHGGGGRHGVMKRFVASMIDDVLDQAQVAPEQRTSIHGVRDRVFAAFEAHRKGRGAHLEEALALFTADQLDPARLEAFRARGGTLLVASHDLELIQRLCTQAVWLEKGSVRMQGEAIAVAAAYRQDGHGSP